MDIVRPGLGEIFPWMGRRVTADKRVAIGRRPRLVVLLQSALIVLRVVAENRTAVKETPLVANQAIPIIMAYFMPKMSDYVRYVSPIEARLFSRSASSASAMLRVITPSL